MDTLDILKRDRFELLSCYLDGEVTAAERKQVEHWLATDPETQHLHARLLSLRHGLQSLPVPSEQPAEQLSERVFARVNRPRLRLVLGVAGAVAAVFVGTLTGLLPGNQLLTPQVAEQPPVESNSPEALMLALDQPPVEIPQAPVKAGKDGLYVDPNREIR